MIKRFISLLLLALPFFSRAQQDSTISVEETTRIMEMLTSDSLKGRGNGQPGIMKAAHFIGEEYKKIGLSVFPGHPGYYSAFYPGNKRRKDPAPAISAEIPAPFYSKILYNVIGILPGRSKANEVILFSAHYDHMGVVRNKKDSIMNGANDDASGTTALLMLAKYFAARHDNERTLVFCAFAGEELGLKGSYNFVNNYINAETIIANVNIEMIGVPIYGDKAIFITGEEKSTFAEIFKKNITSDDLTIFPDPEPDQSYYERSDNYSFARQGVVAHTIMGAGENDKCYHSPCDEYARMDIPNMTNIIRAIAKATSTLVSGEDRPKKK